MNEPQPTGGKPTQQTTMIVCQCGSVAFTEEKRTKTAVVFKCAKCGERTAVKGRAAVGRMPLSEVTFAIAKVLAPDPDHGSDAKGKGKAKEPELPLDQVKDEWVDLFDPARMEPIDFDEQNNLSDEQLKLIQKLDAELLEALKAVLFKKELWKASLPPSVNYQRNRAFQCVRVMNHGRPGFVEQTWQTRAFEMIIAEFLSSVPANVLAIVDATDEGVEQAAKQAAAKGKKWSKRKATGVANKVRDALCEKARMGIYADTEEYKPEPDPVVEEAKEQEAAKVEQQAADAADDRIVDTGQLHRAVMTAREEAGLEGEMLIGGAGDLPAFNRRADEAGGFLLRIDGDKRTRTETGGTAQVFAWLSVDDPIDFMVPYLDEIDDLLHDAELHVVELVPDGMQDDWKQPTCVDRREVIPRMS
jgi:hypothetical protein